MNIIKTMRKDCKNFVDVNEKDLVYYFDELVLELNYACQPQP